jgi:hypothetical protein
MVALYLLVGESLLETVLKLDQDGNIGAGHTFLVNEVAGLFDPHTEALEICRAMIKISDKSSKTE